jgi:hypothetical protein
MTAILAAVIFVLVQIAIFKGCHAKKVPAAVAATQPEPPARGEEQLYETIDMELGTAGPTFQLKANEAYATT